MKKKLVLLLTACILSTMAFAGCASDTEAAKETASPEETQAETTDSTQTDTVEEAQTVSKGDPAKQAILVVSFGTSYNDSREVTIGAVEEAITAAYPDYDVKRAFTSQTIIDKIEERDGIETDNVEEAMQRLVDEGYGTLIVQPTHVMNGYEYDEMMEILNPYQEKFETFHVGTPLLTSVEDYSELIKAVMAEVPEANQENVAVVFMGHGTEHFANATYAALDYKMKDMGYNNVFIGTVESYPDLETVQKKVAELGVDKVVLYPLMIVAGDHANNDMAGDEEGSWKTAFKEEGYEVECVIKGLGEYEGIRKMFVEHAGAAITADEDAAAETADE